MGTISVSSTNTLLYVSLALFMPLSLHLDSVVSSFNSSQGVFFLVFFPPVLSFPLFKDVLFFLPHAQLNYSKPNFLMQISNIVTAYVNSLQRDSLLWVCAFCLCMLLLTACTCLCVFVWECVKLVPPPLSTLSEAVCSWTRAHMGAHLQATLLGPLCWHCMSARLQLRGYVAWCSPVPHLQGGPLLSAVKAADPILVLHGRLKVKRWKMMAEGCGL